MLRGVPVVSLGRQWRIIQAKLPEGWAHARLGLTPANPQRLDRAAALLGPLAPGRAGATLRFEAARGGHGSSPAAVARALRRLDLERIRGTLELVAADEVAPAAHLRAAPRAEEVPLAESWDALAAGLPADWTDLYAQLDLTSSDHLDPAALALAPVNPLRYGPANGFRFRCARHFGYGASPGMTRRCLARLDERGIGGTLTALRVLSDSRPVGTQGPVWYVGSKAV
jgi:hypothetical protein